MARSTWDVGIIEDWIYGFWKIGLLVHCVNHIVKAWGEGGENR